MTPNLKKFWESWGQTNEIYNNWADFNNVNYYLLFVLYALDNHNSLSQKMICEYTGITKQTVNSVIRALKKDNYIVLSSELEDKREKQVILTESGKKYANEILTTLYELENKIFHLMGNDRVQQMIESIELFNTLFNKEMENIRK